MRILHIGKYYPPVPGGMERFLGDLVEAQRAAGHDVLVLAHAHPRSSGAAGPDWVQRVPVWLRLIFTPISPAFPFWLRRAIRDFKPDVIHIHMPNVSAFWALMLPSAARVPWLIHWQSDIEQSKLSLRLAYPPYSMFEHALLDRAEAIIATSPQYLDASRPLAPWKTKCHVIPLGAAPSRLPEMEATAGDGLWTGQGLRVLAVGRLTYYKGFETLIAALRDDDSKQLVIVGEGEERARLERLLAGNSARNVRLAGEVDDATLHRLMASCDVFCLPSRERTEAFGIVLLEAMRYAKPIVASRLEGSGVTWVAREGQNALLATPLDAQSWRNALDTLAAAPAKRALLGRLGHQRYLREFDIADVGRRVEAIYAQLLRARAPDAVEAHDAAHDDVGDTNHTARATP
ncbi:MAG TPA: glycosyltransferase, partial [Usitatibacter sp.]|nr:glycosyltransferase [Usitatibacter sp.]